MWALKAALPIIVSNYSHQFGVQIRMQGTEAYTNGQVITIPRLNFESERVARHACGYLAHEAAHIRYTDFAQVKKAQGEPGMFYLFNILEDARVESLIGREFVGVWENLELLRRDYQRLEPKEVDSESPLTVLLQFLVVYASSVCQGFASQRPAAARLLSCLRSMLPRRLLLSLCALVWQVHDCENSAGVLKLARKGLKLLQQYYPTALPAASDTGCDPNSSGLTAASSGFEQEFERISMTYSPEDLASRLWLNPATLLNKASRQEDPHLQSARHDFGVFGAAECRRGREDFLLKTVSNSALRNRLAQKLRTYVQAYGTSGQRGFTLLPHKAQLIPLGESSIFRRKRVDEERRTSVHLLVDVSGSMLSRDNLDCSRGELACISALSLALSLEGIDGIKSLCTFFPGVRSELEVALRAGESATRRAPYFDQAPRGSTPLAQALWYALEQLVRLECERNIVIVITDGIPDSVEKTRQVIEVYVKEGVELYGVGINQVFIRELIDDSVVLQTAAHLEQCLMRLIDRILRSAFPPLRLAG